MNDYNLLKSNFRIVDVRFLRSFCSFQYIKLEIEIFEIKRGILHREPTNVQGTEISVRDREKFEIEASQDREIPLYTNNTKRIVKNVRLNKKKKE